MAPSDERQVDDKKPQYERLLTGDNAKNAQSLEGKIQSLSAQGRSREAANIAEELLNLRSRLQGSAHWEVRDARIKLAELRQAPLSAEQFKQLEEARQFNARATSLHRKGLYREAIAPAETTLRICREVRGDKHPLTANSLNNLAQLQSSLGAYSKAEALHQESLAIWREVFGENHPLTVISLNNLGLLYFSQGMYAKAEPLQQESLRICFEVLGGKHPLTATCLNNLALTYKLQGAYAKAEPLHQEALRLYRETLGELHPDVASSLNNLAALYETQGQYVKAEPLYQESLRICRETLGERHADTAGTLANLAELYESQDEYDKAEPLFQDALRIRLDVLGEKHPSTATSLNSLGLLYKRKGAFARAELLYQRALRIRQETLGDMHPNTANSLHNLAALYQSEGQTEKAELLLERALRISREVLGDRHPSTASSLYNLAKLQQTQGAYAKAEATLTEVAAAYEANRLIAANGFDRSIATGEHSPYPLLAVNAAAQAKPYAAYRSLEFDLARSLLDEQGSRRGAELTNTERQRQAELSERIGIVQGRVLKLVTQQRRSEAEQQELAELLSERAELDGKAAELVIALSQREIADLPAIQKALGSEDALLAWADIGGSQLQEHWGCVVRSEGDPKWERLGGSGDGQQWTASDTELPAKLRTALSSGAARSADLDSLIKKLRVQRLDPLEKHLRGARNLFIVPVNAMAGIPVEVLSGDYTVSYVPSGSVLARLKSKPAPLGSALLALGDPVFSRPKAAADGPRNGPTVLIPLAVVRGDNWSELPGTRVELTQVIRSFGGESRALMDSAASEQSLEELRQRGELAKFRYLHFATHGEANNIRALDSVLILAQDKLPINPLPRVGEPYIDGKLSASEVLEYWKLDAELVTLSACETALGRDGSGDGMLGFAQAFLTAGARSVCLSLWKVDDTATALLMDRFYQNLRGKRPGLDKPLGKAAALDEAKRWLRNLSPEDALSLSASITNGLVRGMRGKGEDLKLIVPAADPKQPAAKDAKPFAHPRYWSAFVLIGDPK